MRGGGTDEVRGGWYGRGCGASMGSWQCGRMFRCSEGQGCVGDARETELESCVRYEVTEYVVETGNVLETVVKGLEASIVTVAPSKRFSWQ
jgi:hypothetical protein